MSHRRSVHETARVPVDSNADSIPAVSVDLRVFWPPDASTSLVAEIVRDVTRRVLATLDDVSAQHAVVVELPPSEEIEE